MNAHVSTHVRISLTHEELVSAVIAHVRDNYQHPNQSLHGLDLLRDFDTVRGSVCLSDDHGLILHLKSQ